jgi:predicted ester cyclase
VGSNPSLTDGAYASISLSDMAVATPPAGASNAELIRWSFQILNERDVEPLRRSWTQATVERFPSGTIHGADAMAGYFQALFDALPDFHMQVVAVAEAGDDVFVHWHLTGTHSGARLEGIEPTGRAIAIDGMDHFVVRDGAIATNFVVFDQMQFARQLGMLPADGAPADRAMKAVFNAKARLLRRLRRHDG